ncbi:MAG: ComF family protein, partial [Acidobacteriota bacterium]
MLIPYLSRIAPIKSLQQEAHIVPVPLHPRRLRSRGFNQSELIAQELHRLTSIPLITDILARRKATWSQ